VARKKKEPVSPEVDKLQKRLKRDVLMIVLIPDGIFVVIFALCAIFLRK
jgi:hypothetical protein